MRGKHLIGDFYDCAGSSLLHEAPALRDLVENAVRASGLTLLGGYFHQFAPVGVTGTVVLAESHVAIHTWPESGYVTLDVFVCNYTADNTDKALRVFREIRAALAPGRTEEQFVDRGHDPR